MKASAGAMSFQKLNPRKGGGMRAGLSSARGLQMVRSAPSPRVPSCGVPKPAYAGALSPALLGRISTRSLLLPVPSSLSSLSLFRLVKRISFLLKASGAINKRLAAHTQTSHFPRRGRLFLPVRHSGEVVCSFRGSARGSLATSPLRLLKVLSLIGPWFRAPLPLTFLVGVGHVSWWSLQRMRRFVLPFAVSGSR